MKSSGLAALAILLASGAGVRLATGCRDSRVGAPAGADDAQAAPYLAALTLSGPSSLVLVPRFSSVVYDYYVRCAAGANELTVSMTASPGAETSLTRPKRSVSSPAQTVALTVDENQAIVATATQGKKTQEYWIRCLPHDFPKLKMVPHPEAGAPIPGYYLLGNLSVPTGEGGYPMVLDGNGVPVWYDLEPDGAGVYDVDNVVSGAVSFIPSPTRNPFEIHRLSPRTTTYASSGGKPTDEHELRALPNGNYLVLQSPTQTGIDLTGLALPLSDGGTESFGPNGDVVACNVQEVDPTGNVVWQWVATDHFDPVKDLTYLSPPGIQPDGSAWVDAFHCNSIDVDTSGNLLISARSMDSVFYVERSTGKVLWKMGGATYSKDDATYVPVSDPFFRQHDARFPNGWSSSCGGGSGQVSLFDDETSEPGPARAIVYDVRVVAPNCEGSADRATSGATVAWQYKGTVSIAATGSFRVLTDGSRTIGWGMSSDGLVFSEVDVQGHDLLDFYFTDDSTSYRAVKVALSAFDLGVLRSTAGASPDGGVVPQDAGADGSVEDDGGGVDASTPEEGALDGGSVDRGSGDG